MRDQNFINLKESNIGGDLLLIKYTFPIKGELKLLYGYFLVVTFKNETHMYESYRLTQILDVITYLKTGEYNEKKCYVVENRNVLFKEEILALSEENLIEI